MWSGTGSYRLSASFDSGGALVGGSVTLTGKIPGLADSRTLLMTAGLISSGVATDGMAIGFNTDNIVCNQLLGGPCAVAESVLVYLDSMFGGDVNARFRTTGAAGFRPAGAGSEVGQGIPAGLIASCRQWMLAP